jgi:hypothetical protein
MLFLFIISSVFLPHPYVSVYYNFAAVLAKRENPNNMCVYVCIMCVCMLYCSISARRPVT